MKTPPWVENATEKEDKKNYLFGDKILFGFPKRTYFELFNGTCSSDKIYSVQTKHFPKDVAAVVYYPEDNVNIDVHKFADGAAVGKQHVFVEYSSDLANLLKKNGVESNTTYYADAEDKGAGQRTYKNAAFVNPVAFEWVGLEDVEEDGTDVYIPDPEENKSNKNKAIIAALIAALSLLN